jgi:Zn-dependent protease with chaperone function
MKLVLAVVAFFGLFVALHTAVAHPTQSSRSTLVVTNAQQKSADLAVSESTATKKISAYTLPPDLYRKAKTLARVRFSFRVFSFVYGLFLLWFILQRKYSAKFRDWAEAATSKWYLQVFVYAPLLLATIVLLNLPLELFHEEIFQKYGISVQTWSSWFGDWLKGEGLALVGGTLLTLLLFTIIRRSPQRWWWYFWMIAMPIFVFLFFVQPYVIDPIFDEFEPLSAKAPELVPKLQSIARRAGAEIPAERMFWMKASDKTIYCNAYVTGFGASKRIVIWDTCFKTDTTDGILTTFGHELGHYALGHIWKGMLFAGLVALALFYLVWRSADWIVSSRAGEWKIRGVSDLASLPALLLLLSVYGAVAAIAANNLSRFQENQADVYALEVTHGIVADPGQAVAESFQKFGESVFVDPDANLVYEVLFFDHPSVTDRVHLAVTYDPWSQGKSPQFVK